MDHQVVNKAASVAIAVRRGVPRFVPLFVLAGLAVGLLIRLPLPAEPATVLVFGLAIAASELLRLDFPDRRGVATSALPFALTLAAAGPAVAIWAAALGTLLGTIFLRGSVVELTAALSRAVLAGCAAAALTGFALGATPAADPLMAGLWAVLATGGFALVSELFVLVERRGSARLSRVDLFTSVALAPIAVAAWTVQARAGDGGFAAVGAGSLALLAVVRSAVNSATQHADLRRAYDLVERERSKLSTLLERSGEGIFVVDADGLVSQVNEELRRLAGCLDEALGRPVARALGLRLASGELLDVALQRVHPGRPLQAEATLAGPTGESRDVLLSYAVVPSSDGRYGGIGIVRDVTAMKQAQRERDDFVAVMTHDLRQPLTGLLGYAQLIEQGVARGQTLEKTAHYAHGIRRGGEQMLRMINNLLELARLEGDEVSIETTDVRLAQLVDEVVTSLDPQVAEKRLDVRIDLPRDLPVLRSSEALLRECVANLVGNAVKYTPEKGRVEIAARRDGDQLVLTVADSGIGISPVDLPHVFTRFYRTQQAEVRKLRGSGLGLALTKTMVERLGGLISVASELGKGTTFTVRLPTS